MKKLMSLVLAVVMVLSLTACGGSKKEETKAPETKKEETKAPETTKAAEKEETTAAAAESDKVFKIGFAAKGLSDAFTSMEAAEYMRQAKENWAGKLEVLQVDCEFDTNKQIEVLENFIAQDVDAIICQTDDPEAILPIVQECEEKGIHFINDLKIESDWAYEVESNPQDDGEILGDFAVEWLKAQNLEDPVILFMQGEVGNQHANAREKYCKEKLTAAGFEVTDTNTANWQRDEAIALMENWCQVYDHIDAVICANDEMSLGVVQVLEQEGRLDGTMVISVDALAGAVKSVADGKLTMTIGKDIVAGCDMSLQLAYDLCSGVDRSADKLQKVPKDIITKDNAETLQKWIDIHTAAGTYQ